MYTYWKATTYNVFYKEPFRNVLVINGIIQPKQNNKEQYITRKRILVLCIFNFKESILFIVY